MGTRFAWATPEYLLWKMTIGQVMMYLQYATEGNDEPSSGGVVSADKMTAAQIRAKKAELRRQYGDVDDG